MGRPPLPIGTWGAITTTPAPGGYRARTRFRDQDGRTRQVERTGKTKGAARAALTAYLTERTTPNADSITAESLLRDVAALWLAERSDNLATNTVRRYREVIADHIGPTIGGLRVREATVTRLDRFTKDVAERVGAPTAKLCVSILSGVMGLAVRHGATRSNPVRDIAPVVVESKEVRAMTWEEVARARAAVGAYVAGEPIVPGQKVRRGRSRADDLLDIVDVMLATGARIGEVMALRWEDVDLDASTVTIRGTIIRGDKGEGMIRQPFTKGKKPITHLLPRFTLEALVRRWVDQPHSNAEGLVFPSQNGTIREPANVRKTLNSIMAQVDLEWVTPHTFRKTVGTVIEREADIRTASATLNHGSEAVTRRHYIERAPVAPDTRTITGRFFEHADSETDPDAA